jgi:hypothetical protein
LRAVLVVKSNGHAGTKRGGGAVLGGEGSNFRGEEASAAGGAVGPTRHQHQQRVRQRQPTLEEHRDNST